MSRYKLFSIFVFLGMIVVAVHDDSPITAALAGIFLGSIFGELFWVWHLEKGLVIVKDMQDVAEEQEKRIQALQLQIETLETDNGRLLRECAHNRIQPGTGDLLE